MACIFYFSARAQGLGEFTWVYSYTISHKPDDTKYLCSVYWAITTLATIGYGDITPKNDLERCICIVWMIFGVGFYSYTIGSLSSLISSIDSQQAVLNQRIYTISEFSEEAGLDSDTQTDILNAIKYNSSQSMMSLDDKMNLFNELPRNLRYEIASRMYSNAVTKLVFFKGRSKNFIVNVMPFLTPHMFIDDHKVYQVGDFADEMYFILSGRIMYVYGKKSFVYKSYLKGSYFGEIEIIEKIPRLDQAVTFGRCDLLVLSKDVLIEQMDNFPIEAESIKRIAKSRKGKNHEAKTRILAVMKMNRIKYYMKDEEEVFFSKSGPGSLPSTSRKGSLEE
jgi:CRP-like cAMP-binding protein